MILDSILNLMGYGDNDSGSKDTDAKGAERARNLSLKIMRISNGHSGKDFYAAMLTVLSFFIHQHVKKDMRELFLDNLRKEILMGLDAAIDTKETPSDE